jgi:PTH1 family peptidyl-tRNA hydrolase
MKGKPLLKAKDPPRSRVVLLLVGLGNPGPKYERSRHNIGFMAADEIGRRHGFARYRARFQSLVAEGVLDAAKVLIVKPTTFMNESGRAVGEAMRFYKLAPADVMVIHDELDLASGKIRIKTGGGNAGHNGLRSIEAHIGNGFHRLRLGIGHPGDKHAVHGYVLGDFAKTEQRYVATIIDAVGESAALLGSGDFPGFMSRVALILNPPKHQPAKPETISKTEP